jgi:lipid-binding SYLF domain-containing protein
MNMRRNVFVLLLLLMGVAVSPVFAGWDPREEEHARQTVRLFQKTDPTLQVFFDEAYGYVVFPDVYKGGFLLLGGARGKGFVYEQGRLIGTSSITQINVGPQLGGQAFAEIIFFRTQSDLADFKKGNYELNAQASAVVVTAGVATNSEYSDGVAIFALPKSGLMAEASVGGQKFSFDEY